MGMIILTGPSASGKTVIAYNLDKKYGITKAITTTTREMRVGEVNGKDYYFVSKEEFENLIKEDKLVEHACYSGNFYGCSKSEVADNKVVVLDPNGLRSFKALNDKHLVSFFIETPEEEREKRMIERQDKSEKIVERLKNDRVSFNKDNIEGIDFVIYNENKTLDEVTDEVYKIYKSLIEKDPTRS